MLVSKEKPELLQKINEFLAEIKVDGIFDEMYDRFHISSISKQSSDFMCSFNISSVNIFGRISQ